MRIGRIGWIWPGRIMQATREHVPSTSVLHVRYAVDPERPWRGLSPLAVASLAGRLSAETVAALADESSGPRGSFLPLPKTDGEDDTVAQLKADIRKLGGALAIVESMADKWGTGEGASRSDWDQKRLGADPPDALVDLARHASDEVYAACGVSSSLFSSADGTAQREAWRRLLFSTIAPLGRIVENELRVKLDTPDLRLTWNELRASDLAGRARAFQSQWSALGWKSAKLPDLPDSWRKNNGANALHRHQQPGGDS